MTLLTFIEEIQVVYEENNLRKVENCKMKMNTMNSIVDVLQSKILFNTKHFEMKHALLESFGWCKMIPPHQCPVPKQMCESFFGDLGMRNLGTSLLILPPLSTENISFDPFKSWNKETTLSEERFEKWYICGKNLPATTIYATILLLKNNPHNKAFLL